MEKRIKKVHDVTLSIRASQKVLDQASAAAHKRGMGLSEATRQFLRELAAKEQLA